MRKSLKIFGILVLIGLACTAAIFLNTYLSQTKRFPYSTGTTEKAFLNSTWKMSAQEIERANGMELGPPDHPEWEVIGAPSVLDKKRYNELVQKDISLWGYPAKVTYEFFDNKLSGYYLGVTVYDPDKTFQEIYGTLKQQFGEGKVDPKPSDNLIQSIDWDTNNQRVSLWITKKDEKENNYYVGMRSSHKQFAKEIENIIATEKKKYF
jgi:hypothetical protein